MENTKENSSSWFYRYARRRELTEHSVNRTRPGAVELIVETADRVV